MAQQWVEHISGMGEKWPVSNEWTHRWEARKNDVTTLLPKSEYRLCDPPEVWNDVTEECDIGEGADGQPNRILRAQWNVGYFVVGYRLRKVQLYTYDTIGHRYRETSAFIVEKKQEAS